jgi:transposase InsO family protein
MNTQRTDIAAPDADARAPFRAELQLHTGRGTHPHWTTNTTPAQPAGITRCYLGVLAALRTITTHV